MPFVDSSLTNTTDYMYGKIFFIFLTFVSSVIVAFLGGTHNAKNENKQSSCKTFQSYRNRKVKKK